MKITVKVSSDQIQAVVAQAWGCEMSQVELHADVEADVVTDLVTDLKGATRAEKIIDKAMATKVSE